MAAPEPDRLHDRGRAGLELVRRLAIGDAVLEHLADHLAAAVERRHGLEMLVLAVEHADAGRPVELVTGEDVEIAAEVLHVDVEMDGGLRAVDSTGMPRACARRTTSFTGTRVPSMFDMWVIATILVRGESSFSNSSMRKLPSSSTGAHLMHRALALAQEMPGHDVGMVLHDREHDLVARLDALAAERVGDQVDRLGGVAGEDDLLRCAAALRKARTFSRAPS